MSPIVVVALYKFVALPDFRDLREPLLACCDSRGVKGSLLLAEEGINGTIAGSRAGIDAVLAHLRADARLADLEWKESFHDRLPFARMKVKLKREIVTLGAPEADPTRQVGTYLDPDQWNALLADPEVLVLDTRNSYEVRIGTFRGALDPQLARFRDFPRFVQQRLDPGRHKKVAMFCTGGIRCEKASSYLLAQGFEQVYHLKGGILRYLESMPEQASLWEGDCYVFDERVAVGHGLAPGDYRACAGCGEPVSTEDRRSPQYREGVCCPRCAERLTEARRARLAERRRHQRASAAARGQPA